MCFVPGLQDTLGSAALYSDSINYRRSNESFNDYRNRLYGLDNSDKPRKGQINYFGSRTYQKDNVYEGIGEKHPVFGSRDVQIGNSYSGDPDATNVFAPILVQENNIYRGKNKNAQYGASVVQSGNSYPHNSGKNIFDPIVIQSNNTYEDNIKDSSTLKPDVKPSRHNHQPCQHVHDLSVSHVGLGMQIKEHEEMSKNILNNLKTDQSINEQCANGKMNLERLDEINTLYLEVQEQVAQLKALKNINRSRKLLCDAIPNKCSKHDHVRRWLCRIRVIVIKKAN